MTNMYVTKAGRPTREAYGYCPNRKGIVRISSLVSAKLFDQIREAAIDADVSISAMVRGLLEIGIREERQREVIDYAP